MRTARHPRALARSLVFILAAARAPAEVSQWELDGDLVSATGGAPLVVGAASPATEAELTFVTASIPGGETTVARFSRGTFLRLAHDLGSNGGGRLLNAYSVILDVLFEDRAASGGWAALVQTDPSNATDGDWFVNPAGGIGISGQYAGSVPDGVWHRLGLSMDLVAGTLTSYIDGERVGRIEGLTVDGRFAATDEILLFADEDGENCRGMVASVQVRDEALDDLSMALLGGPSASGIPQTAPPPPVPVGLWSLDDPADLLAAEIGEDLALVGAHAPIEGTSPADGAVRIGPGSYYRVVHGIAPSPQFVNAYSLAFDFRVPSIGPWYCFFQTNQTNSNDGDCFVRTDGALGVGDTGYSGSRIAAGTWYRMVVAVDNVGGRYEIWVDGDRVLDGSPQAVDGRFSLDPTVLLFADENGEDGPIDVAMVALYDRALSADEIARLGGPGISDPDNHAPRVLELPAGPETVDAQVAAPFEFRAADEDGDLVQLRVAWGDGVVEPWGPFDAAGEPFVATHSFRRTGVLEIQAQARDEHGRTSAWTRIQSIEVTGEVPAVFLVEPYLQNLVPGGVTVMWELDAPVDCRLEHGPDASYGEAIDAEPEDTGYLSYVYRVRLRGLQPGDHHFRVVAGALSTDDRAIRLPSGDPAEPFSFSVWGDSQGTNGGTYPADPYEPTKSMFDHMAAGGDDLAVTVGDLAENGADWSGVHRYYLDRVAARLGRTVPWFVAWGNHDAGRTAVIRRYADLPSADREGFDPGWGSFSFDHAGCHFVCIDYSTMQSDILAWLEGDLAAAASSNPRFTFLFVHVPPYCEIWIDGDAWLRTYLVPLLEEYGVDACFSGHTHEYERGVLRETWYVITGGGSWLDFPEPYTVDWPHITVGGHHSLGDGIDKGLVNEYVRVRVDGDVATVEMHAFHPDGTYRGVLDAFSIDRCANGNGTVGDSNGDGVPDDCAEAALQVPGDMNQDGRLDLSDPARLLGHMFLGDPGSLPCEGGPASSPGAGELALLDSNGDGKVDLSDAVGVLAYLFLGAAPPVLGTECVPMPGCPSVCP